MIAAEADDDSPIIERPLTEDERDRLTRSVKTGPTAMLRFFGAFVGIIPLFLVAMAAMGSPMVWENYFAIMFVAGFLGLGLGTASWNRRLPILKGAAGGIAREVWGVPEVREMPGKHAAVALGGLTFRMRTSRAATLLKDRMNRITYVDGGPVRGPKPQPGSSVAIVIEWNGTAAPTPEVCSVTDPANPLPTAAASPFALRKRMR